ncbi:MAG: glycoside hydrolase, partial [Planctomycetota bacterium]
GRSRAACEQRGRGRVYLDFLLQVCRRVRDRGVRPMFWADVILQYPELVPQLPRDAVAVAWGYEAGHPFEEEAARLAQAGLEFYLCPGTSSWQSLVGRVPNLLANLREAAAAGLRHGASGLLIADWGDFGHWQPPCTAWPGWVAGAGHAWRADAEPLDLAGLVDRCMLREPGAGVGRALADLGRLESLTGAQVMNGTSWFFLLRHAHEPWTPIQGLTAEGLRRTEVRAVEISAGLTEPARCADRTLLALEELRWAADLTAWACRLGRGRMQAGEGRQLADLPAAVRASLARGIRPLIERMRELWLRGSRPGGLADSARRLQDLATLLGG